MALHGRTLAFALLCASLMAWANTVSYQGILTNSDGDSLLSGSFDFSFAIFSTETGGTPRWAETHGDVAVSNGVYSVVFGSVTALPDSIGATNWLQITVEGTVLTPRIAITSDFRAIESLRAQNADSVNHISARTTPTPNHLVPLDATGRFPESVMPFTLDSILAGQGLTGAVSAPEQRGGNALDERLTVNVGAGTGITVTADQVSAVLGTSISNAEIDDNAVTSGKVQDNTLTTVDISPDIVSSVNGVHNDGGNIDLISGANISIVPDDSANSITISAAGGGGGYSAGRCLSIVGNTISNTMTVQSGDVCIGVTFDSAACAYSVYNTMNIINGFCTFSVYDANTCTFRINLDLACLDSLVQVRLDSVSRDSVFHSEVYAQSFVVTDDGTLEHARAHLRSDGRLEIYDETGRIHVYIDENRIGFQGTDSTRATEIDGQGFVTGKIDQSEYIRIRNDGTWFAVQNGQTVAGLDSNGESYAKSFYVRDSDTGDTLIHLTSDGEIQVLDESGYGTVITRDGVGTGTDQGISIMSPYASGVIDGSNYFLPQSGVLSYPDGTIQAIQNGEYVAGVDAEGEMYAKSFYTVDENGDEVAHLDNAGNLSLPSGAQITIGGQPIEGGGIGDEIQFEDGANGSHLDANGLSVESGVQSQSVVTGGGVSVFDAWNLNSVDLLANGTWQATQNNVNVAGLQSNGEIHAKSFEVRDSLTGVIKAHLTNSGGLTATGTISGQYVTGTTSLYSQSVNGSTTLFSDLSPGSMRSQTLLSNVQQAGWTFFNNGTMTQWVDPPGATPPMLNMQTTADGYWMFNMPLFIGPQAGFHYLFYDAGYNGMQVFGNFKVNGKLDVTGNVDPIISEAFLTDSQYRYEVGTVLIADPNSDKYIPCTGPYQTSVVGVVSPDTEVDDNGYVLATILGAAASFKDDGSRLEVKVKADAKYGAIRRGDLLTTSATPGYAMLAAEPKIGTIVGKALESLTSGTGEIKIMVTLQ